MIECQVTTYTVDIYIAGDLKLAEQVCREFCLERGFCVTVAACEYVYTGGQESGVRVGCINYPRFPTEPDNLWRMALSLADMLRERLCQHSFSIVAPDRTLWRSFREQS